MQCRQDLPSSHGTESWVGSGNCDRVVDVNSGSSFLSSIMTILTVPTSLQSKVRRCIVLKGREETDILISVPLMLASSSNVEG